MSDYDQEDTGSVKIHPKVLADIATTAVNEMEGVRLMKEDFTGSLKDLFGFKHYPGVKVSVNKKNSGQVSIEVKVAVQFGVNIPDIARQVQDAVRAAVEKTVDIDLKEVNVNIQGIERREK